MTRLSASSDAARLAARSALAQPLTLPGERLANRLAKAAMTEGLADAWGRPSPALGRLYHAWARSGAGLLITGNVVLDRDHLERPGNVVLDREPDADMREALRMWAKAGRAQGAGLWMQLSHAGRQTPRLVNPTPSAPSAVPVALPGKQFGAPRALDETEIVELIARFAGAAAAAREAGFTGVQVHAAHGYLISQFLSPRANRRRDAWGGDLEGRARFLMEVVRGVRAAVGPDFTVSVKLNSADFQKGGFGPEDSLTVLDWLADAGVDIVELSGGSYEQPRMAGLEGLQKPHLAGLPPSTAAREAYFLDFAAAAQARARLPLMVTGGFRSPLEMAEAVAEDGIALIGLGRPMTVDPLAPAKVLAGATGLERWESRLRLGPGLLGPRSPFAMIKAINGFGAQSWYYQQIRRMGAGLEPKKDLSILTALRQEQADQAASLEAFRAAGAGTTRG